jgi:hypothetical protein
VQARCRIGLVDRQPNEGQAELVANPRVKGLVEWSQVDRDDGGQPAHPLVGGGQLAAQRAGDYRESDVVDPWRRAPGPPVSRHPGAQMRSSEPFATGQRTAQRARIARGGEAQPSQHLTSVADIAGTVE